MGVLPLSPTKFFLEDSLAVASEEQEDEEEERAETTNSLTRVSSGPEESTSRESVVCDSFFGVPSPAVGSSTSLASGMRRCTG